MHHRQKIVVVGAGPVGSLAALYAAQRGHDVEIYELRPGITRPSPSTEFPQLSRPRKLTLVDLRDPSTVPLNFTKSINLALSERGITAIRGAGQPKLLDSILETTIPMRGRMIHGRGSNGKLYEESQDYDVHGKVCQ